MHVQSNIKNIGFLSFGHWTPGPQAQTRSGSDALLQSIDLAVAAEEIGVDGAYFRVHHFARQLASPFPLLAAIGPRVSVSRSIFPVVSDLDRAYFGREAGSQDQVGQLDGGLARFGKTYAGEPEQLVQELAEDEAVAAADTLLLTIPNQLGVDYNVHLLNTVLRDLAPALGWR